MRLKSTRDEKKTIGALSGVLKGISDDGGLYIPEAFPALSLDDIVGLKDLSYPDLSAKILGMFFDELSSETLKAMTKEAYASFDAEKIVPIKKMGKHTFVMELYHGPTLAFKDVALQILPRLMAKALEQNDIEEDILILTATSGDTGKAALEGFCDVPRVRIMVFYPHKGVSEMQHLQMATQEGDNTAVVAVKGNFDDTQNGVKQIFTDLDAIKKIKASGYVLSSANSINIGRLTPQIVYYFWSYLHLLNNGEIKAGDKINVSVPTGNFGNILAAYYAYRMGLPIKKLICASNTNRVLTDFFLDHSYRIKNRAFIKTMSPSMDILISSNLERLIADIVGSDQVVAELMEALKASGTYEIEPHVDPSAMEVFYAGWANEAETLRTIKDAFKEEEYLVDPHTAVGLKVLKDYVAETGDQTPCVVASTASPYKFAPSVLEALTGKGGDGDAFEVSKLLSDITKTQIPNKIAELQTKEIRHGLVIERDKMLDAILSDIKK